MNTFVEDFFISEIQYFNHYYFDHTHIFNGHRHDCWELNVVLDGEVEVTYDDIVFSLGKREVFIGEPNIFHRNRINRNSTAELIVIHFISKDLPILMKPQIFLLNDENLLLFKLAISKLEEFRKNGHITPNEMEVMPYSFKKLLEVFMGSIIKESSIISCLNKKETIIYNQAVTYMKSNLHRSCLITEIASECCVCNTTIKNIFRKYTGQGVNAFFMSMKLEYSKVYLQQNYSIAETSELLGFTSQAYFSQVFKKMYGYAPLKYKNNYATNAYKSSE